MDGYEVRGDSLLSELVAALTRRTREGVEVVVTPASDAGRGLARLHALHTGLWMVVAGVQTPDEHPGSWLAEGAVAVVDVLAAFDDFRCALEAVDGKRELFVSTEILRALALTSHKSIGETVRLTPREEEVVALVAQGHSNGEIARALTISANTVRTHMQTLSRKLQVESRTKMVARARTLGLLGEVARLEWDRLASGSGRQHARTSG